MNPPRFRKREIVFLNDASVGWRCTESTKPFGAVMTYPFFDARIWKP